MFSDKIEQQLSNGDIGYMLVTIDTVLKHPDVYFSALPSRQVILVAERPQLTAVLTRVGFHVKYTLRRLTVLYYQWNKSINI